MNETKRTLVLFDDARARGWEPFSLTRPVATLPFGALRLADRANTAAGSELVSILTEGPAVGWQDEGLPRVGSLDDPPSQGTRVFLSSRVVLPITGVSLPPAPASLSVSGQVVGWVLPDGATPPREALDDPGGGFRPPGGGDPMELPGSILDWPWTLMSRNADQLRSDLPALFRGRRHSAVPAGAWVLGDGGLTLGPDVEVEPGAVLDTREGPIHLSDGVQVRAFTRLSGPALVGSASILLGGEIGAVTIGTTCRIRGEVADSVIDDYVNKAHDGHLGHALVGRWVNLGAGTTNSDLKNTYGSVRVRLGSGPGTGEASEVDTGLMKVGSFLGDHVKTGIGTLLPTGAVVGAGSNVFGGIMAPGRVAAFRWVGPSGDQPYRLDRFLQVAQRAMGRRNVPLDPWSRETLARAWEAAQRA